MGQPSCELRTFFIIPLTQTEPIFNIFQKNETWENLQTLGITLWLGLLVFIKQDPNSLRAQQHFAIYYLDRSIADGYHHQRHLEDPIEGK